MRRTPVSFRRPELFRAWLEEHGASATELHVRCFKVRSAARGMTYAQALDEALCLGWIDGVRHAIDAVSFSVRFTPRKRISTWSAVNIRRVQQLAVEGRLAPQGRAAFEARRPENAGRYSFEAKPVALARAYVRAFAADRKAWAFFQSQPPWYRRTSSFWVMSAKREETRRRRLAFLIASSAQGAPIPQLDRRR